MCRSPFKNKFDNVKYYIGDVTKRDHCRHVVQQVKPNIIFNTASPHAYKDHEHVPDIFKVNVDGNVNLLQAAYDVGTVKAYVYTSSGPIIAGSGGGYDHADETHPTLVVPHTKKGDPYHVAKALGDKIVLEANGKNGIRTCTIRPTALYGEGDGQMVGPVIKALEDGQTTIWTGYNDIDMDVVYVGHVAIAEVQAAKGLLVEISDPKAPKVSGEAFNITDDQPSPPLTFFRKYWALAGDETPLSSVWYIHPTLVLIMAHIAEWIVWARTWGKLRPESLILERMEFVLFTRTYSIKKARERLGFKPWGNQPYASQDEALKGAVEWYLRPENHGPVKIGGSPSWPEVPFSLISNTGALDLPASKQDHYCVKNARIMAQTHNTIFRALNSIYQQALSIKPGTQEAIDMLAYCGITYDFIHHHQIGEESIYFPEIEKATKIPGLMEENIAQHHFVEDGLERLRKYAETTRPEAYSGEELRHIIDEFSGAYEHHQHEEIKTILNLHDKIDSKVLKSIDLRMRKEAERQSDIFKAAPFVLSCQDRNFKLDGEIRPFPGISALVPYVVHLFLSSRHAGVWRFAPSTMYAQPRPSPARKNDEPTKAELIAPPNAGMPKGFDLTGILPSTPVIFAFLFGLLAYALYF
ncbi:NAD(P)-binding protein [Mollisia scopiformis]|uniref:NAD(P)-binding protein n=1 Tax=Mollisia scopiformis TaxID=149040 RepID=A0A132BAV9_MOLSC|nr:NAD(P)-binding protein [Mollisia scopiformis]KUJ09552.1 NAD(P)-binding protein [Mollisia scopiformis]